MVLCFGTDKVFQKLDRVDLVLGVARYRTTSYVYMCAPALLVGENHAHAFDYCFVGGVGGAHQARQVVGVGHSNATLAAGHGLYLVGVTSLGCARTPKGGDTDQIKAVASGECGIAVTNTYYLARLMRSTNPADKAIVERVGVVFPNQQSWGTHVNVAGGAIARHSKNQVNAVKFLEYLVSSEAQNHFANGNNEWPVVKGLKLDNPALNAMTGGSFKSELVPISAVGMNQVKVQQMLDRVGFK